jgi:hypothetical protein
MKQLLTASFTEIRQKEWRQGSIRLTTQMANRTGGSANSIGQPAIRIATKTPASKAPAGQCNPELSSVESNLM